jgi:hypothetical protein
MTKSKLLTGKQLATALRDMALAIDESDSYHGSIEYEAATEKDTYNVRALYAVGNSDRSQGGVRMIMET